MEIQASLSGSERCLHVGGPDTLSTLAARVLVGFHQEVVDELETGYQAFLVVR